MSKHERHDRNKNREYTGEEHAARIVDLFNIHLRQDDWARTPQARESKERVQTIFASMSALMEQLRGPGSWPKNPAAMDENLVAHFLELNFLLQDYVAIPALSPTPDAPRGFAVHYIPVGEFPPEELDAASALTHLALLDKLDRIQLCVCDRWYFVRFSHQKFCSEECRIRYWESSEERKSQKRAKAREYYQFHKVHQRG